MLLSATNAQAHSVCANWPNLRPNQEIQDVLMVIKLIPPENTVNSINCSYLAGKSNSCKVAAHWIFRYKFTWGNALNRQDSNRVVYENGLPDDFFCAD